MLELWQLCENWLMEILADSPPQFIFFKMCSVTDWDRKGQVSNISLFQNSSIFFYTCDIITSAFFSRGNNS